MKHVFVSLLAAIMITPAVSGQEDEEIRSHEIGVSFNLVDYTTAQLIRSTSFNAVIRDNQFGKDMNPGLGVHYFKGLKKKIDFAGSLNTAFLSHPFPDKPANGVEKFLLQIEGAAHFKMVTDKYWLQPFLIAGFGAQKYDIYYGAYVPLGLGLNVNFFSEGRLFINSTYRVPVTTGTANYHFLHSFGIAGRITKKKEPKVIPPPPPPPPPKDTDNDGIIDDNDKCPTVAGLAKYEGCPVPDTDKDGLNDENDKCPTVAGLAKYEGCPVPDTDKDGINDEDDRCINQPGVARYQGCPVPDTDGDTVNDEEDKCPRVAGPADNFGCPIIGIKSYEVVFRTGSSVLLPRGKAVLDTVAAYLQRNPGVTVTIDGHTDNTGSDRVNNPLSVNRAEASKTYLVKKGINGDRMTTAGFGSTQPVADNKTAEGRQKNRRIEIKIKG
ncbi:MAG TPA: OmpA family protein [Chitinophagaceae bacterium]|nr:OmpA family protein [Chitinophagaceae bacterium]